MTRNVHVAIAQLISQLRSGWIHVRAESSGDMITTIDSCPLLWPHEDRTQTWLLDRLKRMNTRALGELRFTGGFWSGTHLCKLYVVVHDGAHSGRPNTVWHIWEARGDGGRPHRQSSKNGLAYLGAGGVGGGRIGSHPNTVWHWEACGVGGGRIGSRPKTVWHVWEPAGFGEAA